MGKATGLTRRDIDVDAKAVGNGVECTIDGQKPDHAKLKLDKDSGGHEITFALDRDKPLKARGLRFDCANPIYAHASVAECPSSGVDEQIEVISCSPDKLTIYDKNCGDPKQLRYRLNFIDKKGIQENCDPIIENGGGHTFNR